MLDFLNGTAQITDKPVGTFYVFSFKGLDPKNGMPLFNKIDDESYVSGKARTDYLVLAGKSAPDLTGGFHTAIGYKSFSVGLSFNFSLGSTRLRNPVFPDETGQSAPLASQNMPAIFAQRWRKPGDEKYTNIPAFVNYDMLQQLPDGADGINRYYAYNHSDLMLVSGNFLRCSAISFGYQLPQNCVKKYGIKGVGINATVSNLFVIADKRLNGQDPEIQGIGGTAMPIAPAYNLGLNVSF